MPLYDPFHARDTFDTGNGDRGDLPPFAPGRRQADQRRAAALFDPHPAGGRAAELRRLRRDRARRDQPGRLERRGRGRDRSPLQAGPRDPARLHRRALRGRSGGHAQRHAAARRRPEEDQSAGAGRPGDRPLGAGRLLRPAGLAGPQRGHRVRPQPRALRVPPLGPEGV